MSNSVTTTQAPSKARNFTATCVSCGEEFAAGKRTDKTCSTPCRAKYNEHRKKELGTRQEQQKRFKSQNPNYAREYRLIRNFGITLEQYEKLLETQGGVCAVCAKPPKETKAHAVDHDHKTGEIFGILCHNCNYRVIGKIRDPVLFERASKYLSHGTGLFVPEDRKRPKRRRRKKKNG